MKPERIKEAMRRAIASRRRCAVVENMVLTEATLPAALPFIREHLKKRDYIAAVTPGHCYHCGRPGDLRFGVCDRCCDETFTDGIWVWHSSKPDHQWAIPKIDHVIGRWEEPR